MTTDPTFSTIREDGVDPSIDAGPVPVEPGLPLARPRSSSILGAGAAYTVLGAAQSLIGLVLLPLFTNWLTPAEYGQIGVLVAISSFAMYVLPLGLEAIVLRGWFRSGATHDERLTYASEVEAVLVTVPFALAPVLTAILAVAGLSRAVPTPYVFVTLVSAACFVAATIVPYAILRADRRVRPYVSLGGSYVAAQVVGRILLVGVFQTGVTGWVIADIASSVYLLIVAPWASGVSLRPRRWTRRVRQDLRQSLPLVPHGLGQWGLAVSDRLVLTRFVPLAAVGVYSLGYQACTMLVMLFSELNRAITPDYAAVDLDADPLCHSLRPLVAFQSAVVVLLFAATAFVGPQAILLLLPSSYSDASTIVPWVALGAAFVGLYQIPMNHIAIARGDTQRIWFAAVIATVANIVLNIVFVPTYGIIASAVITASTYFLLFALVRGYERYSTGTTLLPDWRLMARYGVVILVFCLAAATLSRLDLSFAKLVASTLVSALAIGAVIALFWHTTRSSPQEVALR